MNRSPEHRPTVRDAADPSPDATVLPTQSAGSIDTTRSPQPSSPATVLPEIGKTLGPYRLLSKLGEGGMGAVYKAQHEHLDKTVAIKVLPQQLTQHADSVARFKREMKAVGKLEHPHIVRAMDAGEIHGTHFLAMEYVDGVDVQKLVKDRGALSVPNACKAIRQAALALTAAHAAGLIHRDIKPANLLVAKTGQIKLLDLGLARLGDDASQNTELTQAGQAFGTPDYMAPEQWHDAHAADARTDLYALGCTLFYLLTARAPYGGETHRTAANKMKGHVIDPIPDLVAARPDVPAEVVAIYQKLMAKDPAERYQKAAELVEALAPFVSSKGTPQGAPPTLVSNVPASGPTVVGATIPHAIQPQTEAAPPVVPPSAGPSIDGGAKSGAPRRIAIAAGGVAAALLLGVIVITITRKDGTTTKVEVPGDAKQVDVSQDGQSLVKITSEATPAKTDWHGWPADAPKPAIAPFDAAQAKKHQEEWAAYLKVPVEYTNSLGMQFRLIPPGEFEMGSTADEIEAQLKMIAESDNWWREDVHSSAPRHRAVVTKPFYVAVKELSQAAFEHLTGQNPSEFSPGGTRRAAINLSHAPSLPVEQVSWNDAMSFGELLNFREGIFSPSTKRALAGVPRGYRLPTEAEWEYFCRAGTTTRFWTGDDPDSIKTGVAAGEVVKGATRGAAGGAANPFGLHYVHGNVNEWCLDGLDKMFYSRFASTAAIDPLSPVTKDNRPIARGGDWRSFETCFSSSRFRESELTHRYHSVGLRMVISVEDLKPHLRGDATTTVAATDAEKVQRQSVEAILAKGGKVTVALVGDRVPLEPGDQLPSEAFVVKEIELISRNLRDADLLSITPLTSVEKLTLNANYKLTSATVPWIVRHPLIRFLFLEGAKITNPDLAELAKNLSGLEYLALRGTLVTADGLEALNSLERLNTVAPLGKFDAERVARWKWLANVEFIGIDRSWLEPEGLTALGRLQKLRKVSLDSVDVSAEMLTALGRATQLTQLQLYSPTRWSREHAKALNAFTDLTELQIYKGDLAKEVVMLLPLLPKLKALKFAEVPINLTEAELDEVRRSHSKCQIWWNNKLMNPTQ